MEAGLFILKEQIQSEEDKSSFISLESAIRSAFIGIGVNGIQGSVMKTLGINERSNDR